MAPRSSICQRRAGGGGGAGAEGALGVQQEGFFLLKCGGQSSVRVPTGRAGRATTQGVPKRSGVPPQHLAAPVFDGLQYPQWKAAWGRAGGGQGGFACNPGIDGA